MPRILLRTFFFRFLLCGIGIGLFPVQTASAQAPTDMKVLEEHRTANGDVVRTIQYTQGGRRVTETRTIKQFQPLTQPIDPDTLNRDSLLVVVSKSRFVLDVYYKRKKIRSYKVVFGPKPKENKMMKGDRCTPEGKFSVLNKHASARYDKFIQIDYPNDSSRVRFELLKKKGVIPATAEIGGDVGIHGIWKGGDEMIDMGVGWTDGCIAMKNKDIEELYSILDVGVKVFIRK